MSRDYHPNNPNMYSYNVNSAGTIILGKLHKQFGASIHWDDYEQKLSDYYRSCGEYYYTWNTKFISDYQTCIKDAEILSKVSHKKIKIFQQNVQCLFSGTFDEFLEFISSWIKFLNECNGYDTSPDPIKCLCLSCQQWRDSPEAKDFLD